MVPALAPAWPTTWRATIAYFKPGVEALAARLPKLLDADERGARRRRGRRSSSASGVPRELAERVVTFDTLYAALDIAEVAAEAKQAGRAGRGRSTSSCPNRLGLAWLREKIAALPGAAHWQMLAKSAMHDDLSSLTRTITAKSSPAAAT